MMKMPQHGKAIAKIVEEEVVKAMEEGKAEGRMPFAEAVLIVIMIRVSELTCGHGAQWLMNEINEACLAHMESHEDFEGYWDNMITSFF